MAELGHYSLLLAFLVCWYTIFAAFMGAKRNSAELIASAYRGVWAFFGLLTIASIALMYLLAVRDMNVEYVARYTSSKLPMFYAIPAFWAGNGGSLLLWAWILSLYSALVVWRHRKTESPLIPYGAGILMMIASFFMFLILFLFQIDTNLHPTQVIDPFYAFLQAVLGIGSDGQGALHPSTNPFWRLPFIPREGMGLNPQLQNPGMMFHPPTLYLGYVGMAVPFAFGMAALVSRKLGNEWLLMSRRWTITAWFFLSIGNLLGAWWAYVTLGWGGYWAWDPVENAAFIPWLLATAFLHSVMIQEKRGMLKIWNMVLIVSAFGMTIFGTYLTRSGIISSVHAFARNEGFNISFLLFLATTTIVALYFIVTRIELLESEHRLDSLLSRESAFLYNNVVLVGAAFVVLFGTMFPLMSQWLRGVEVSVGPMWFNKILWPMWAFLLVLTGIGPIIAWRRADTAKIGRNFVWPVAFAVVVMIGMPLVGFWNGYAIAFIGLSAFVIATVVQEFYRGTRTRMRASEMSAGKALTHLVSRQNRRYGGYIIHLGIVLLVIGVVGSSLYQSEADLTFQRGTPRTDFAGYGFEYVDFRIYPEANRDVYAARLQVYRGADLWQSIDVVKERYHAEEMTWTKPTIIHVGLTDVYVTLSSWSEDRETVTVTVKHNPLVSLLWLGGVVLIFGTVIAMWPDKRERMHRQRTLQRSANRAISTARR
jgi:cytochrome c-type biogenesis protein CcmF